MESDGCSKSVRHRPAQRLQERVCEVQESTDEGNGQKDRRVVGEEAEALETSTSAQQVKGQDSTIRGKY